MGTSNWLSSSRAFSVCYLSGAIIHRITRKLPPYVLSFFLLLLSWVEREVHSTSYMWWANYPSEFEFWKAVLYNRYKIIDLHILPFPGLVHYCNWLFSLKKLFVWNHDVSKHLYFKKLFCYLWTHTNTTQN